MKKLILLSMLLLINGCTTPNFTTNSSKVDTLFDSDTHWQKINNENLEGLKYV